LHPLQSDGQTVGLTTTIDVKNVAGKIKKNVKKRSKNEKRLKTLNKKRWP